jgi:hypothetical protein
MASRAVAQRRASTARQHSGSLSGKWWCDRVANEVHASVDSMKPSLRDSMRNRAPAEPDGYELGTADYAMLLGGDQRNGRIPGRVHNFPFGALHGGCGDLCTTFMRNSRLIRSPCGSGLFCRSEGQAYEHAALRMT